MRKNLSVAAILLSTAAPSSLLAQTTLQSTAPIQTAPSALPNPTQQPVAPGPVTPASPAAAAMSPAVASDPSVNNGSQDIVVTANKRSENIQKVGLSITAISGQALAERKITSIGDVAAAVPGLSFAPS